MTSSLSGPPLIHVPEGTSELRADPVGVEDARVTVAATEIRRVPLGPTDEQFVSRRAIAVAPTGDIAVLDIVTGEIVVLRRDGGDLQLAEPSSVPDPMGIGSYGRGYVVAAIDAYADFDLEGRIRHETRFPVDMWTMQALPDGALVALEIGTRTLVRLEPDGSRGADFTVLKDLDGRVEPATRQLFPQPEFVVGGDRVYVTPAAGYEVAAFNSAGEALWLLRVPWRRDPVREEDVQLGIGRSRRAGRAMGSSVDRDAPDLPELYPALAGIDADAAGRLYVFPYVRPGKGTSSYPVDVYAPDGQPILHGRLPFQKWDAVTADSVYRVENQDGVSYAVEYRIDLPDSARLPDSSRAGQ